MADVRCYYFAPDTKAPITLLELGLYMSDLDHELVVYCPKSFWRYGNVKILCDRFAIDCHEDEDSFLEALRKRVTWNTIIINSIDETK